MARSQDRAGQILASCSPAEPCCVCGWRSLSIQEEENRLSGHRMAVPVATCRG